MHAGDPLLATPITGQVSMPSIGIRDIVAALPEFDPMSDTSLSSVQFVHRVQTLKNAYQWRDDVLILAAQQKLKSHARLWVDAKREVFTSWQQFAGELISTFPFDDNPTSIHIKMASIKREKGETPQAYYYKILTMGIKFGLNENAIARHIINGINEPDLGKKISNEYHLCSDLLRDIDTYCRYNEIKTPYEKPKMAMPTNNSLQVKNYAEKRLKCYNCQRYGHISTNCSEPQQMERCGHCRKTGHKTMDCKNTPNKNLWTNKSQVNNVEQSGAGNRVIMKGIKINGVTCQAFVDPGSARTLIRASFAGQFENAVDCHVNLNGFGGGTYVCERKIPAEMIMDECVINLELLVVNDKWLEYDVLLGRDALCHRDKRIVIVNEKCWLENVQSMATLAGNLDKEDCDKLKHLLASNKSCFAENAAELGSCTISRMDIKLTSDTPINARPYRIPFAQREEVRDMLSELLQAGIIRNSSSPYASPVVLVAKKNGELRMCVDYRQLNRVTEKVPFPMPVIEEQLALLSGSRYFTTLDLRMGYHQVEMEETAKKYTAFITVHGHFEYNRMPFGLVNAPAMFQSIMNTLATKMGPGEILTYLDDVIIPSRTVAEGLLRLEKLLNLLRDAGLTLRLDKCQFLRSKITYLGHTISKDGISPGDHKINAVRSFSIPKDVTEVRRFLGLTGFFRRFIQDYALISKPLTALLRKTEMNNFHWEEAQQQAFEKLVTILCNKPVLTLYDHHADHEVHTDASSVGLAGVLLQAHDKKQWRPVFYYSRHCSEAERRYHAYELEVLAAVETLTRFRVYLLGKKFRLITDCSALARARDNREMVPKISRWYMKLLEYDFEKVHRPAERLAHVDALSRAPVEAAREVETAGFVAKVNVAHDDWLLTMQLQDKQLAHVIAVLKGTGKSDQEAQLRTDYQLKNFRLYRKDNGLKFVVPSSVRWRIVKYCHDDVGHFGLEKTIDRVRRYYWFPRIRKYTREYLAACVECCFNKAKGGKTEGCMHYDEIEPLPFSTLHLDHLGPFVRSSRGMSYVLAISDGFSKYLVVKPVRTVKSSPVLVALNELTSYFGLPKRVITDRGTAFTSKVFTEYCSRNNIQHTQVAVRTPRANGQVERANQLVLAFLRTTTEDSRSWDTYLRELQWTVNSQRNTTSGFAPNELIFDFRLRDIVQNRIIGAIHDDVSAEGGLPIKVRRQTAAQRITEERSRWKARFDNKHKQPTMYEVDDLVVVAHEPPTTGESRKLVPKYRGPYIIIKVLGNDRYVIGDVPGMQVTQRQFDSVYASDKLKRWCSASPELNPQDDSDPDDSSLEDEPMTGEAELSARGSLD